MDPTKADVIRLISKVENDIAAFLAHYDGTKEQSAAAVELQGRMGRLRRTVRRMDDEDVRRAWNAALPRYDDLLETVFNIPAPRRN